MRSCKLRMQAIRAHGIAGLIVIAGSLLTAERAAAEERKFVVMLAHSPKSFTTAGVPGLPPGGLFSEEVIRKDYFDRIDPTVDSFTEYWEEISYGDVIISGEVFGWVTLPWVFDPNPPNAAPRPSPADFINLRTGSMISEGFLVPVPDPFAYGAGEDFCDVIAIEGDLFGMGGADTTVSTDKCGVLIIIDLVGETPGAAPPVRGPGMWDFPAVGINVWTPGERFVDLDGDSRWDGIDEKNDMMCHDPDGCSGTLCLDQNDPLLSSASDKPCFTPADCPTGETCTLDPRGSGPRGCDTPGCGDLDMPCIDWNGDSACTNPSGNEPSTRSGCTIPVDDTNPLGICSDRTCVPTNCVPETGNVTLPECCEPGMPEMPPGCEDGTPGVTCGDPILCCEFDDFDGDNNIDVVEPFEDFIVRWNPSGRTPASVWKPVDADYIRNNYPGDTTALIVRMGNGYYNPPDLFVDFVNAGGNPVSTKMMQDAGVNQFAWRTPKPGARYSGAPNFEQAWFGSFWSSRYGSTAPPWPGGSGDEPDFNSPIMRPFDPQNPVPPVVPGTTAGRRWFQANRGGWNGFGRGTADDIELDLDVGTDNPPSPILPEEEFGYYDGWVEHDDLASSKYHSAGDKRFGEIISPTADQVTVPGTEDGTGGEETYTAIFGVDLGKNNPLRGADNAFPDTFCIAAGPEAVNIHGEKGFDAGDVCIVEWLTWRTDGTSRTSGSRWAGDNGNYHPFASRVGFRDYNLDGMIDQGEVRPELSENYSVDSDPSTRPNTGNTLVTNYPFNRLRLVEDVVEALDPSVKWDDFVDRNNRVSGIVLVPSGSHTDINLFPLAAEYYSIHTQDASGLRFHDLVTCLDCRGSPSAITFSAHEYMHTWENYPDLYDYDVFPPGGDAINCPIGVYDIMAGSAESDDDTAGGGLVHPNPVLKARSGWVDTVDLESVLTPGVERTLTLPAAEFVRDESYFVLSNSEQSGERFYFWSAGSGFDERFPGQGMLIMRTVDFTANFEALALKQRQDPYNFLIVQADGNGDLEACESTGNTGDAGDLWPGSSTATRFNLNTNPSATWQSTRWTGLDISNIQPDGRGSVLLTLSWVPTNIPSLRFTQPPGGASVGSTFTVLVEATDVHGGTTIELYYTADDSGGARPATANLIQRKQKGTRGTNAMTFAWNIAGLDGRFFLFAKLIPGIGSDGRTERKATEPRAGRNNRGNGTLALLSVDATSAINSTARSETWTVVCIDPDGDKWLVSSSLSQPEPVPGAIPDPSAITCPNPTDPLVACTGSQYTSTGGEVTFRIAGGSEPFRLGDTFTFVTTGITGLSKGVVILDGRIRERPWAVINASPLAVMPQEDVTFDARDSRDPNGEQLSFVWDFGDGSTAAGAILTHRYTIPGTFPVNLTATNPQGLSGEAQIDIVVINNSPNAVIRAEPTSGRATLTVRFDASDSSDETPASQLVFEWTFGDGETANPAGLPGQFITPEHRYTTREDGTSCTADDPCTFIAALTVTDPQGKRDTDTVEIIVGNSIPEANITARPNAGPAPLTVRFNADASSDQDNEPLTVTWDFDDGASLVTTVGDGDVPHTYTAPGTYRPSAVVSDGHPNGEAAWSGDEITVTAPVPEASDPIASFIIQPDPPLLDEEFTVNASSSRDRPLDGGAITKYEWDFDNDGTVDVSSTSPTARHTYTAVGTFTIKLTVFDNEDPPKTDSIVLTVDVRKPSVEENRRPVASFTVIPPAGFAEVTEFVFNAGNSRDPDGDDSKLKYTWRFGDGLSGAGVEVKHRYDEPQRYTVRLTVRDEGNATTEATQEIVVQDNAGNLPPRAFIATGRRTGTAPLTVTLDGRNSFDPNGDPLIFTWEFKENGDVIDTLVGAVVSRRFDQAGTFTVELEVFDGRGGVGLAGPETILVTPQGTLPPIDEGPERPQPGDLEPPDSARQRPGGGLCGFGMLGSLFASLLGLTAMMATRRYHR